jgi:hypothetical protein
MQRRRNSEWMQNELMQYESESYISTSKEQEKKTNHYCKPSYYLVILLV